MHQCLTVDEILSHILVYVSQLRTVPGSWHPSDWRSKCNPESLHDYAGSSALLALALSCKTFRDPALDRLWSRQFGLGNLICLLPEDVLDISMAYETQDIMIPKRGKSGLLWGSDCATHLEFKQAPKEEDWIRFDHYAPRVRELVVPELSDPGRTPYSTLSPAIFRYLRQRPRPLLPNLRVLGWSIRGVSLGCLPDFDIFVGPSLRILSVETWTEPYLVTLEREYCDDISEDDLNLVEITPMCPKLTMVTLQLWGTLQLRDQISLFLKSLKYLEEFRCHLAELPVTYELLDVLSHLPALRRLRLSLISSRANSNVGVQEFLHDVLKLDVDQEEAPEVPLLDPTTPRLSARARLFALEVLDVQTVSLVGVISFLEALELPALRSVHAEVCTEVSSPVLLAVLRELPACATNDTLTSVVITSQFEASNAEESYELTLSDLMPLKRYPRLETMVLYEYTINHEHLPVDLITSLWPHLDRFPLCSTRLRPIKELDNTDFLRVFLDIILSHYLSWTKGDTHHGNLSMANFMCRKVDGRLVGVLNDWDLAFNENLQQGCLECTGTMPYMSIHQLRFAGENHAVAKEGLLHAYYFDLEACFWVLVVYSLGEKHNKVSKWMRAATPDACLVEKTTWLLTPTVASVSDTPLLEFLSSFTRFIRAEFTLAEGAVYAPRTTDKAGEHTARLSQQSIPAEETWRRFIMHWYEFLAQTEDWDLHNILQDFLDKVSALGL